MSRPERKFRATTPEAREDELISLAYDLAERQLREGSASAQVITQFLKMGTERERLERDRVRQDNLLIQTKINSMESAQRVETLIDDALAAMRRYSGSENEDDYNEYEY